ncbi:hypothetical protein [Actinopolymorpha alba]|uniref:hypothetical protein n=1 Tax=Actinopolymorpha alba TaxID=533267 RepID=UPI000372F038|nr:hypothetical protein [Actinopolymorpha alba]
MRRVGAAALSALLLIAVVVANRQIPDPDRRLAPIATEGKVGEDVDTGGFAITVEKVQVTRKLAEGGFSPGPPLTTDGIWLVLTATLTGNWKVATYDSAELRTPDGTIYLVSERPSTTNRLTEDYNTEPGIPRRGQIVFELPPDQLAGAVFRISGLDTRLAPQAVVDLGLDAATARRLIRSAAPQIELTSVGYGR